MPTLGSGEANTKAGGGGNGVVDDVVRVAGW